MNQADLLLSAASRLALQGLTVAGGRRLSILIFHRVLPQVDPIFPSEVDAARFDRLMALVARSYQVLPLSEAVQRLERHELPAHALAITFDDGYADNHDIALPILQRHGLPACFFIATGFLDGGRMFNDTVIECIRHSTLDRIDLADFGVGVFELHSPEQRAIAIGKVLPVVKYLTPNARVTALATLTRACKPSHLPDDLMMSSAKVRGLHTAGMEIGAHTVHHPILATMEDAVAEHEMNRSRQVLQGLIDHPVSLFAYPNGRPDVDYTHRHAEIAERLGFAAAVSTSAGVSMPGDDRYQLPRFTPWDASPRRWMTRLIANQRRRGFAVATPASARADCST